MLFRGVEGALIKTEWFLKALTGLVLGLSFALADENKHHISGKVQNANDELFIVQDEKQRMEFSQVGPRVRIGDQVTVTYTLAQLKVTIEKANPENLKTPDLHEKKIDDRAIYFAKEREKKKKQHPRDG